ncbi:MAG: PD40 domain-containing protein [Leptospiraceae bacterium]|nr:PD40 domain-containing protein [Leptospiraceae bacterium]
MPSLSDGIFGPPLNTGNVEYNPVISPNGRYIVFQSNRPGGQGGMDIWISENKNFRDRTGDAEWTLPRNFTELNTDHFEGMFSIHFGTDGKPDEIFFTSEYIAGKREGYPGLNIYYTKKNPRNEKWYSPIHLNEINSNFEDKMPTISPDGNSLIFVSNRPGGFGGFDLWKSVRDKETGVWSKPKNLGSPINSPSDEIMPSYHYDGNTLYFSSNVRDENNKFNLYGSDLVKNHFEEIYSLGKPFNSKDDDEGISLTHDGNWAYFSSNRLSGEGQFDIYRTQVPEDMRRSYPFELSGLVLDGSEPIMIGIESTLKIYDESRPVKIVTSKRIGGDLTKSDNKNFETNLSTGKFYRIEVSAPGFHPTELTLDLRGNIGQGKKHYLRIILQPIKNKKKIDKSDDPTKKKHENDKIAEDKLNVLVKDQDTKQDIVNATVTLFTEKNKNGVQLKIHEDKKEIYGLSKYPEEEFEILAQKKGYKDSTVIISKNSNEFKTKSTIVVYLKSLNQLHSIYNERIYFKFNEYKLTNNQKIALDKIAEFLLKNPKDKIEIGGHTDNIASKEFNVALSQKRSEEVFAYFRKKGIHENRMRKQAYWYSQPESDNQTEEGRRKNRRVNFRKLE